MPRRGRRNVDQVLLMALACGATVEVAAHTAGVSAATVYRRKRDPEFGRQLQQVSSEMVQRTAGMLTGAGGEAVKTLLALLKETAPPAVRLGAARAVLEGVLKFRQFADFEQRLAALEEQVARDQAAGWQRPGRAA
jgi:hypothetical protein